MVSGIKQYDMDPADLDPNGIAENQTTAGAGNLTLDGALCDLGTAGQFDIGDAYGTGVGGVRLLIDSAGDVSGVTFTITGKDQDGASVTEDVTGVTTTAVSTTKFYSQVTQIAADGAVGSNVFVGTVTGELVSPTYVLNRYADEQAAVAISASTGTWQADIEQTFDNIAVDGTTSAVWFLVTNGGNLSADAALTASQNATGVRCRFDSYTNGAELQFHVASNPYR